MSRGVVARQVVRVARRRLGTLGRSRRLVFLLCVLPAVWSWWAAQASGYAGLPVNMLGQIAGDLVLMGLLAPTVRLAGPGCIQESGLGPPHTDSLATARHCVQLLDPPALLRQLVTDRRASLVHDLRAALQNDIRVEILLPDPAGSAGRAAARRLGLEPGGYGRRLERLLDEVGSGLAQAQWRGLDLRLYSDPVEVCFIRCDRKIWVSMHPNSRALPPDYVALNRRCGTAALFQAYFEHLHSAARPPSRSGGLAQRPTRDLRTRLTDRTDERRR